MTDWQAISAVGTFVAVGVALFIAIFGQWATRKIFGPRVRIEFESRAPFLVRTDRTLVPVERGSDELTNLGVSFWVRVRIHNAGKSTAERCKVKLLNVQYDGGKKELERFDPVILRWVSPPLGTEQFKPLDILRDEKELCNLLSLLQAKQQIAEIECDSEPRGAITAFDLRKHTNYWLDIVAFGENFKPVYKTLEVEGTANWHLKSPLPVLEVRERGK